VVTNVVSRIRVTPSRKPHILPSRQGSSPTELLPREFHCQPPGPDRPPAPYPAAMLHTERIFQPTCSRLPPNRLVRESNPATVSTLFYFPLPDRKEGLLLRGLKMGQASALLACVKGVSFTSQYSNWTYICLLTPSSNVLPHISDEMVLLRCLHVLLRTKSPLEARSSSSLSSQLQGELYQDTRLQLRGYREQQH
jgi:hypothetical protein